MDQNDQDSSGSSQWVDEILYQAIQRRASDIHIEPEKDSVIVRFRIDGLLTPYKTLDKASQEGIVSRIKILSKIDITDHRVPKDGHFEFVSQNVTYNIRVSTLPTSYGETVVMRILNREDIQINLELLGFLSDQLNEVTNLTIGSAGMILITGASGAGKTTLLYSMLHTLIRPEKNVVTIEDPIELQVAGIRQSQVNDETGLTFSRILRSVLRQDPDVIMLGEIRDNDTAQMSIQASLTGILVLSTFHTFDVPALVTRLMEMGITNSVLAQAVKSVISTRLVRKICETCKQRYLISENEKRLIENNIPANFDNHLFKGAGCVNCQNLGYLGRIGIFEVITFDDEIRSSIIERKPASYMFDLLAKKNITSQYEVAFKKIFDGETTLEEVIRVLGFPNRKN